MNGPIAGVVVAARVVLDWLVKGIPRSAGGRALAGIAAALLATAPATAAADQPLSFFKNYFVTGDYAVRGVSLWRDGDSNTSIASGRIPPLGGAQGVPPQSDILAAFLYVQTAESVDGSGIEHATFDGVDLGPWDGGAGSFAKQLVPWSAAPGPCWDVTFPGGRRVMTYRADVLRFLPIDPTTGKHDLNVAHRVTVPDAGRALADIAQGGKETKWSSLPRAFGAALVVVYRDPTRPFSAIVLYDGAYRKPATATMTQELLGFYQAAQAPGAKMSHLVGDGSSSYGEQVSLGGTLVAATPYAGTAGPNWDLPTFVGLPLAPGAASAMLTVTPPAKNAACLNFSAIVLETAVQDTDGDGLLDVWETASPPPNDPNGVPLPDLRAMGADPNRKDLFVEIDFMTAAEGTRYGGVAKPAHSHLPEKAALARFAAAFANAGVSVHLDVGGAYQEQPLPPYIIPATLARGGKSISETAACPNPAYLTDATAPMTIECVPGADGTITMPGQYPAYPGTVGWKTGFQFLRDVVLGFDRNRKDVFHHVLFAHALGIPKVDCLNADGSPDLTCQDTNPDFHVPRTNSGIADFPGGDVLVTLGAFENAYALPVGTTFMQASTLMHELGHDFELTHAGLQSLDPAVPRQPNCKPLYLSVMNYLYQLRGLPDAAGKLQLDYSWDVSGGLNELVSEVPSVVGPYRIGWYAPWKGSYLEPVSKPARKHCNGSDPLPDDPLMVRVDAPGVGMPIDWDADGVPDPSPGYALDVNFSGYWDFPPSPAPPPTSADWASLRFSQLGGRRSPGGFYVDAYNHVRLGPLSLDVGRGDIGRGDIGRGDIGRGDIGRGDIGRGDIGRGDIGRGDIGRGVFGLGDLDLGGYQEPPLELDVYVARAVSGDAPSPPNELSACLTTGGQCAPGGDLPVLLTWSAPNLGQPVSYALYRFVVGQGPFPPAPLAGELINTFYGTSSQPPLWNRPQPPPTAFLDTTAPAGQTVAYYVVASFADGSTSGVSNFATVVTPWRAWYAKPIPISPANYAVIPQDSTAYSTFCPAGSWYGFQIVYTWQAPAPAPPASYSYEIIAQVTGASNPAVHKYAPAVQTSMIETQCNAYVPDAALGGWTWQVRVVDSAFQPVSDWSPAAQYQFAPCYLADGRQCSALWP